MIGLLCGSITVFFLLRWYHGQGSPRCVPKLIDILTSGGNLNFELLVTVRVLDLLCTSEIFRGTIVTFGTPMDEFE